VPKAITPLSCAAQIAGNKAVRIRKGFVMSDEF
jgi:hypothetical protein